ncbi:hypothetical protein FQR65_LT17586 [Abscondita terminalis]|nr:hypothetical protein FQR65_LT17586 [Abscondita terminalis]
MKGTKLIEAGLTTEQRNCNGSTFWKSPSDSTESNVRPDGKNGNRVKESPWHMKKTEVVGMISVNNPEELCLFVSEKGYVTQNRFELVAIKDVTDSEDLMIINKSGIVIRIGVADLRVMGRATQGVRLINLKDNDEIASITKVEREEDEEITDIDTEREDSENTNTDTTEE